MKGRGLLIVAMALTLIAVGAVWISTRPAARVEVMVLRTETLRAYVEEQAVTELPTDYLVATLIDGWLEPISLREGDIVQADQVLARLDTKDLIDVVRQTEQRIAVLETKLAQTADHRLEQSALTNAQAVVKAVDEMVRASEQQNVASQAVADFARTELDRVRNLIESSSASERELREAETQWRKSWADYQSDVLYTAAIKTMAAVSYLGPKFITDYIDRKSFEMQSLNQQLEEARARLEIDRRNVERAEVRSPIDGVVLQRRQTRRQYVPAGTALLTLGKLDDMEVIVEALTERATRIEVGAVADVFGDAIPDGPIRGIVKRVYPAGFKKISSLGVEQQRVNVAIGLEHRPPRLGVGFRVQARIYYDEAPNAHTVPRTALFRGERGDWRVLIVEQGRLKIQPVRVGLMNEERAQILEGIAPDAEFVLVPARELVEGMRVAAIRRAE